MGKKRSHHKSPHNAKVILGGLSGIITTAVVHPFDVLKVRLQVSPDVGIRHILTQLVQKEGYKGFYSGLSAGVTRQACYTTTRLGVYYWLYDHHKKWHGKKPSLSGKLRYGVYAGLLGAAAGCPSELLLVRMAADGAVPQRRYQGLVHGFSKICREEGVLGVLRGSGLTLTRSVCFSVVQLGSYSQVRETLSDNRLAKGFALHMYTSLISSFLTAVVTLPIDLVKTRYQAISENVSQAAIFSNCLQAKGLLGLWKGFTPYYTRLACHTILTFYLFEILNKLYIKSLKQQKVKEQKIQP